MKKLFITIIILFCVINIFSQVKMHINTKTLGTISINLSEINNVTFTLSEEILYTETTSNNNVDIYKMNPDGSGRTPIKIEPGRQDHPRWSPNKDNIAYISDLSSTSKSELFIMKSDGTNSVQLTSQSPQWGNSTPNFKNSNEIWFGNAQSTGITEIYKVNTDGSGLMQLTNWQVQGKQGDELEFFNDRTKVIYRKQNNSWSPSGEIYISNIDFTNEVQLTNNNTSDGFAKLTPDNSKIIYCSEDGGLYGVFNIYKMNIDGSNVVKLTNYSVNYDAIQPIISPDGNWIIFTLYDGNQSDLYKMDINGNNLQRLTNTPDVSERAWDWK